MSMLTSNTGAFIEGQQYGKKKPCKTKKRKKTMACGKKHSYNKKKTTPVKRKK